jgi:arsenite methyltransferase
MKRFTPLFGWLVLPTLIVAQDHTRRDAHEMHQLHQDPQAYIAMLDDPQRDAYQKPHDVITALDLKEGEVIADLGAGSGCFTFRLARHVGACLCGGCQPWDDRTSEPAHPRPESQERRVGAVAGPDDPLLAEASVDRFFICNTWHHVDNRDRYLALLRKMLKPGGEIVMVDFKKAETPVGPPMEMRIDRNDLVQEMERNGFRVNLTSS